jgi:hypothetical protein
MEMTGKITRIENTEHVSDNFKKRRLVLSAQPTGKYQQTLEFTFIQGNVDIPNGFNPGDEVRVQFELKGKEITDKNSKKIVFNTLEAYRLDMVKKSIDFIPAKEPESKYADDDILPF